MNFLRLHGPLVVAIAGALALVGCSDSESPSNNSTAGDTGVGGNNNTSNNNNGPNNNSNPDSGVPMDADIFVLDVGFPDSGPPPDSGILPCPTGQEGCACTSTFGPNDTAVFQDNCDPGLLCVPWDGPEGSCVRPCTADAECGVNPDSSQRRCSATGFAAATGIENVCVDALAELDQFCGFSKLIEPINPNLAQVTTGRSVGCPADVPCTRFSDINQDEGICLELCDTDADCTSAIAPFCNPNVLGNPPDVGICSPRRGNQGDVCGIDTFEKLGFTSLCNTSSTAPQNLQCLPGFVVGLFGLPDLFDANDNFLGLGICGVICTDDTDCAAVNDPVLGPTTCSTLHIPLNGGNLGGMCGTGCGNFPADCGPGRFCEGLAADIFNEPPIEPLVGTQICIGHDDSQPRLARATFDERNGLVVNSGDNCLVDDTTNEMRCPEGATCFAQDGRGYCLTGCSLTATSTTYCSDVIGTDTTTCAAAFQGNTTDGLCTP